MSATGIFAALGSIAAIIGGITYVIKLANQKLSKTPDQVNQEIDQQVANDQAKEQETGRPQ
jgi:hypothetical protein